ncbi:MAG: hypothetical protein ABSF50_16030 [Burkholderiaceae bacterium]
MSIRATVLVSQPDVSMAANPLSRVQQLAWELEASGFKVLGLNTLGVSVRADQSLYQATLGLAMPLKRNGALEIKAPVASLVGRVSQVTVANPRSNEPRMGARRSAH